jgi:fumarate hydratase class II
MRGAAASIHGAPPGTRRSDQAMSEKIPNPDDLHAFRVERDSLGEVRVPAARLYGAQTERARINFPIGGDRWRWGRPVIRALGLVKAAAARANAALGELPPDKADAIAAAAEEVAQGRWDDEFPLSVFQTGSGTQTNMNANEVIARRASRLAADRGKPLAIHPNDDVNRSQSSNDVFPTVMHVATVDEIVRRLLPVLRALSRTLAERGRAHEALVMIGRTHLQDATPLTFGQMVSGWVAQLDAAIVGVERALPGLHELAIGGTAVGTGLNAPAAFGDAVAQRLAQATGHRFVCAPNRFAALASHDAMVGASAALRTLAGALMKLGNDVRWYASGPRAGIGEIRIPSNEPGSSIMPGKINPTQVEALTMVAVRVFGNDHAVAFAGSQGNFQLNVYKPVMLSAVLDSVALLADAVAAFDAHCAQGIEPDAARIREHLEASLMLVTALSPHVGYEKAAKIALTAYREGRTLRDVAVSSGLVSGEDFDRWVRPEAMTRPD